MAREFFDYDPVTGLTYYLEQDFDPLNPDLVRLHTEQDVTALVDHCERLRNENIHTVKDEYFHYAKIPTVVQLQLLKKGINIFSNDPAEAKRARQEIEANYPRLKTSYAKHI